MMIIVNFTYSFWRLRILDFYLPQRFSLTCLHLFWHHLRGRGWIPWGNAWAQNHHLDKLINLSSRTASWDPSFISLWGHVKMSVNFPLNFCHNRWFSQVSAIWHWHFHTIENGDKSSNHTITYMATFGPKNIKYS